MSCTECKGIRNTKLGHGVSEMVSNIQMFGHTGTHRPAETTNKLWGSRGWDVSILEQGG